MNLLEVKNLTKSFGSINVIKDIDFSLKKGHNIALIGANGAGKTTTLRMLTGLIKPSSGAIRFKGTSTDLRNNIGYLPQQPVFHDWMTGEEYLNYVGQIMRLPRIKRQKKIQEMLYLTNIYEARHKRISKYSGGMKQRLGIAQALLHEPQMLILDEPVSALDPVGRREILTLMKMLKNKMTVLFSTHILADAEEVCDDVILMHKGKVIESQPIEILREKYQTTVIEIIFSEQAEKFSHCIEQLPYVTNVNVTKHTIHIVVTDIDLAKHELLKLIVSENWPIKMFRVNEASLEDMFLKAVEN